MMRKNTRKTQKGLFHGRRTVNFINRFLCFSLFLLYSSNFSQETAPLSSEEITLIGGAQIVSSHSVLENNSQVDGLISNKNNKAKSQKKIKKVVTTKIAKTCTVPKKLNKQNTVFFNSSEDSPYSFVRLEHQQLSASTVSNHYDYLDAKSTTLDFKVLLNHQDKIKYHIDSFVKNKDSFSFFNRPPPFIVS